MGVGFLKNASIESTRSSRRHGRFPLFDRPTFSAFTRVTNLDGELLGVQVLSSSQWDTGGYLVGAATDT